MLKIQKWRQVTNEDSGYSCEIGRLTYAEKPILSAMMAEVFSDVASLQGGGDITPLQQATAVRESFQRMDHGLLQRLFETRVRNIQEIETEDGPVTTGAELFEVADQEILLWVCAEWVRGSSLSEAEGKVSESPSTSSLTGPRPSDSDAGSTASEDGSSPSTVPETAPATASSTQVA